MSFVHSLFLLGGLAIAVPILIHMSRSRNFRRVRIGTLRFLTSAVQERRSLRKIENWPLLIARMMLLLLLALLFARPFWLSSEAGQPGDAESVVLVDSSGSLAHPEAAERVAAILERIRKDMPAEGTLTIAEFADVVRPTDHPAAIAGAPTDYTAAIDWTVEHLANSEHPPGTIHLITDLQLSPLPSTPPRLWPSGVMTEVHAVAAPAKHNLAIESVTLATPFKEKSNQIDVVVRVFGTPHARELADKKLTLQLEGGSSQRMPIPPEGGRVRFLCRSGELTELSGSVSIDSLDPWTADDRRDFSFQLKDRKKVLLVDGDPGSSPFLGEAYFLNKALLASGASHGQSPFTTTLSNALTTRDGIIMLDDFDAIALCNVASFSKIEAEALRQANAKGAGLLFVLGELSDPNSHATLQALGLFPDLKLPSQSRMAPVTHWDIDHPALSALPAEALRGTIVRDAFVIEAGADWNALASFSSKHPLLLEGGKRSDGQAPVMVLAHPLTREWGDFPLSTLFVPLMRETFSHLAGYRSMASEILETTPGLADDRAPGSYRDDAGRITLVSADVTEMNPEIASAAAFRKSLGIPEAVPQSPAEPVPGKSAKAEQNHELWPWLLLALLLVLIVENTLADRRLLSGAES
ncbi:BatA domain-containing protein [Haloferula chungangensis]|uniref:BatA domain-containing protein n=1 Tax=Haloferula chungangensis TaxID=1048331 RepID=A0ABW2L5X5_9BACT